MTERFPPLDPLEVVTGMALAVGPPRAAPAGVVDRATPREALRAAVLRGLQRPPCLVSFSGGRDSSAVLAVCIEVARSQGLPLPVPVTLRFPGATGTREDEWQERVVRHLGLADWERVVIDQELDIVGPVSTGLLLRHGLPFPPQVQSIVPAVARAAGGSVLTGTGGDELFVPWRGTRRAAWQGASRVRNRRALKAALLSSSPVVVRRAALRRRLRHGMPWLTPAARRAAAVLSVRRTPVPRSYAQALEQFLGSRSLQLLDGCLSVIGRAAEVQVSHPLLDPAFVAAVGARSSPEARRSRTAAMRDLVGDLLPEQSLSRGTKAVFNEVLWGQAASSFASRWSGAGVDTDLVDVDQLRRAWARPSPSNASWSLLQSAWLADGAPSRTAGAVAAP